MEDQQDEGRTRVPRPLGSVPPTRLVARKSSGGWQQKPAQKRLDLASKSVKHDSEGICWGKHVGSPWWPCQKITAAATGEEYTAKLALRRPRAGTLVQFFGAGGDCCWLISSNIVSWKEGLDKGYARDPDEAIVKCLSDVIGLLAEPKTYPLSTVPWWCDPARGPITDAIAKAARLDLLLCPVCHRPDEDGFILCANETCDAGLGHFLCLGFKELPTQDIFCDDCKSTEGAGGSAAAHMAEGACGGAGPSGAAAGCVGGAAPPGAAVKPQPAAAKPAGGRASAEAPSEPKAAAAEGGAAAGTAQTPARAGAQVGGIGAAAQTAAATGKGEAQPASGAEEPVERSRRSAAATSPPAAATEAAPKGGKGASSPPVGKAQPRAAAAAAAAPSPPAAGAARARRSSDASGKAVAATSPPSAAAGAGGAASPARSPAADGGGGSKGGGKQAAGRGKQGQAGRGPAAAVSGGPLAGAAGAGASGGGGSPDPPVASKKAASSSAPKKEQEQLLTGGVKKRRRGELDSLLEDDGPGMPKKEAAAEPEKRALRQR